MDDLPLLASAAAAIVLTVAAPVFVSLRARKTALQEADRKTVQVVTALSWVAALLWLAWSIPLAYGPLWQADALMRLAQARSLWVLPLVIAGFVWAAALLVDRLVRALRKSRVHR